MLPAAESKEEEMTNTEIVPGFDDEKDDSCKIRLQKFDDNPGVLAIYLTGYIDTYNSNYFIKRISKAIEMGFNKIIFHMAGLSYCSSTGIGTFTQFMKMVKPKGGDLVMVEIQPKVYEVFQLLGFSQFFNITESLEDAIQFFVKKAVAEKTEPTFPVIIKCPICTKRLKTIKAGRFRCPECKTILAVSPEAKVNLG